MPNENATAGLQADFAAKKLLMQKHQDEFLTLLGDEREKRGLPRTRGTDPRAALNKRIENQEKKLAQLRAELEKLA